jgi:glutaredoxin 3
MRIITNPKAVTALLAIIGACDSFSPALLYSSRPTTFSTKSALFDSIEEEKAAPVVEAVEPNVEAALPEKEEMPAEIIAAVEEKQQPVTVQSVSEEPSFFENLQMSWRIFQESKSAGFDFKQSAASALAGEYDQEAIRKEIGDIIQSNPCVMFTWEASPACKQAVEAFNMMGAEVKNVRLDDPWEEGNPIRAEIGKMVGRSSVPMIFIGGEYVGGYDGGVSEEAPGILKMSFKGTLRPKLETVYALKEDKTMVEK